MAKPSRVALRAAVASLAAVALALVVHIPVRALLRPVPPVEPPAEAPGWSRESCATCHAPIAEEWSASFHRRSLEGPWWGRIRERGFDRLFAALRVPCTGCHAPARVLDLELGGLPPTRDRATAAAVDCASCHVSAKGIHGRGRTAAAPHPVLADPRFRNPELASTTLCATCHEEPGAGSRVVSDWRASRFADEGITCLDCHMPSVEAPSVRGGPPRRGRSHAFPADKSEAMLRSAVHLQLDLEEGRVAVARIVNDRVGHALPAGGMNWVLLQLRASDASGAVVAETERGFGTIEWLPGYLDFPPFRVVTRIPPGEARELRLPLPHGRGTVRAEVRYRDWFAVRDRDRVVAAMERRY